MYYVYGKDGCHYCVKAKQLLEDYNQPHVYLDVTVGDGMKKLLNSLSQHGVVAKTVPQVFYQGDESGNRYVGGFKELYDELK